MSLIANHNKWTIHNGVICIIKDDGYSIPSAESVYSAVFEDVYSFSINENDVTELKKKLLAFLDIRLILKLFYNQKIIFNTRLN